ncbi:hypothetical protein NF717_09635 [Lactococcus formosensis]|uniref:Uncharacterized protein n=2 Tax=Lactococcus formosensis TaxID=1281486 RepID=A0A9X4P1A3_9LACT|nr:hypothetical protein [Lactococcus formosensis]MDG6145905.1 hypothetical protein [Lactococcus formosensis]
MKYYVSGVLHAPVSAEIEANSKSEARDIFIDTAFNEIYTTGSNGIAVSGNRDSIIAIDDVALSEDSVEVEE